MVVKVSKGPFIPYDSRLCNKPLSQTLSNVFEITRKTACVSREGHASRFLNMLLVMARNCDTQESCFRKQD